VLVVDDDDATRNGLTVLVESWGYNPLEASDGKAAFENLRRRPAPSDRHGLDDAGMNGLEFVTALGERAQKIAIVFVTGQATIDTAVQAIKLAPTITCPKPLEPQRLREVLKKASSKSRSRAKRAPCASGWSRRWASYGALIGKSAPMRRLISRSAKIAPTDAAVLVSGESVLEKSWSHKLFTTFRRGAKVIFSLSTAPRFPDVDGK